MKNLIIILTALVLAIMPAIADVSVESAIITPGAPLTSEVLDCSFKVQGNETSYSVNVTWKEDGAAHIADDQTLTANNNSDTSTTSIGDVEAADTSKGEEWICVVTASDNSGNTETKESAPVTITNTAPTITSRPITDAYTGERYTYPVVAQDADNDILLYSLTNAPTGMNISDSGLISWTPSETQDGIYDIVITVTDTSDATATQDLRVTSVKQKLILDKLDASCSPKCDENLNEIDGGNIREVQPGSSLELEIKLENIWPDDADDHDIEDIEILTTLEDMGDEDEQDEDEEIDRIKPGDDEKVTLKYDIPKEADEDTYKLEVDIEGTDEDGTVYRISFDIEVEVEKESHQMIFQKASVQPTTVKCSRNIEVDLRVKNIGAKDEEDAQIFIRNSALGISRYEFFDVDSGDYDDDDTEYDETFRFTIGNDVPAGVYELDVKAYYEDDDEYEREILPITVEACVADPVEPEEEEAEEEEPEEEVEVIEQPTTPITPPTQDKGPAVATPVTTTEKEGDFFESTTFLVILALAVLVLFIIVIALAMVAFRK